MSMENLKMQIDAEVERVMNRLPKEVSMILNDIAYVEHELINRKVPPQHLIHLSDLARQMRNAVGS